MQHDKKSCLNLLEINSLHFASLYSSPKRQEKKAHDDDVPPFPPLSLPLPCACDDRSAKARSNERFPFSRSHFSSFETLHRVTQQDSTRKSSTLHIRISRISSVAFARAPSFLATRCESAGKAALRPCSALPAAPISSRMDCGIDSSIALSPSRGRLTQARPGRRAGH